MNRENICSEEEIRQLVLTFYARVRADAVLGPVFDAHVADWGPHLDRMVDFWSGILRGTSRFRGTPMPKHIALPKLDAALFNRWLALFRETTAELGNPVMREYADGAASRIAQSLWYGYQRHRQPDVEPAPL